MLKNRPGGTVSSQTQKTPVIGRPITHHSGEDCRQAAYDWASLSGDLGLLMLRISMEKKAEPGGKKSEKSIEKKSDELTTGSRYPTGKFGERGGGRSRVNS